jgi:aspartate racemase
MSGVGLVGGLGPESTIDYYRRLLSAWQRERPGSSPSILIDSLDVRRALALVEHDREALTGYLLASVNRLAAAGVSFAALTANTAHVVFDELAARSPVPLVSIVEVCAEQARRLDLTRVALLGTRFTMEAPFYPDVLGGHGIAVALPEPEERALIHDRYINELLAGVFRPETREAIAAIVDRLRTDAGIDGVVLAGTELPLLLGGPIISGLPALDTTGLHVDAIVTRLRDEAA